MCLCYFRDFFLQLILMRQSKCGGSHRNSEHNRCQNNFSKQYLLWVHFLITWKAVLNGGCLLQLTISMFLLSGLLGCLQIKAQSELSLLSTVPSVISQSCTCGKYVTVSCPPLFLSRHTLVTLLFPVFPGEWRSVPMLLLYRNDFLCRQTGNSNSVWPGLSDWQVLKLRLMW